MILDSLWFHFFKDRFNLNDIGLIDWWLVDIWSCIQIFIIILIDNSYIFWQDIILRNRLLKVSIFFCFFNKIKINKNIKYMKFKYIKYSYFIILLWKIFPNEIFKLLKRLIYLINFSKRDFLSMKNLLHLWLIYALYIKFYYEQNYEIRWSKIIIYIINIRIFLL